MQLDTVNRKKMVSVCMKADRSIKTTELPFTGQNLTASKISDQDPPTQSTTVTEEEERESGKGTPGRQKQDF